MMKDFNIASIIMYCSKERLTEKTAGYIDDHNRNVKFFSHNNSTIHFTIHKKSVGDIHKDKQNSSSAS